MGRLSAHNVPAGGPRATVKAVEFTHCSTECLMQTTDHDSLTCNIEELGEMGC